MRTFLLSLLLTTGLFAQAPFQVQVTGHGPAMILIPGLASSGETWNSTVAHYKEHYQCHVLTIAGFAGVPRVPGPMLDRTRDAIADYIKEKHLVKPVIVGHSLGGFWALAIASKYPDLPGKIVIVDSYPFLAAVMDPSATPESAKASGAQMAKYISQQSQEDFERYARSGASTRAMVTKDSDLNTLIDWSVRSDRTAIGDAMGELMSSDLRAAIASIKCPTLVMGSWIAYKQYGASHDTTLANLTSQYANLKGVQLEVTDTARHFIMWDDPQWMFSKMDTFLEVSGAAKTTSR